MALPAAALIDVVIVLRLALIEFALHLDPLAEFAQVALALRLLRLGGERTGADARIGIESARAIALDRQLGALATSRARLDGQGRALEFHAGPSHFDPFDARVTTIVMDDLRRTAPVGRLRGFAV